MADKIWLGYSLLGGVYTTPTGMTKYQGGKFVLDKTRLYNTLRIASNEGANICRITPFCLSGQTNPETVFQPFIYAGNGKWDILQFNGYYFPLMREIISTINDAGMTVWLELFDHCSIRDSIRHLQPMVNNIQGRTNYYAPDDYVKGWVDRMLTELGDTVKWGLGNELIDWKMVASILPTFKAHSIERAKSGLDAIIPFSYGAELDIAGEKASNSTRKLQSMEVEKVWNENVKVQLMHCCHKACNWKTENVRYPVAHWRYHSIAFSDDGRFPRPQGMEWGQCVEYVLNNQNIEVPQFGQTGKARLLFEVCPETENAHLIIRDMVTKCEAHGVTFENKGKFPNDWVEPVKPDPVKPKPKSGITWQGWVGLGVIAAAIVIAAVLIF